MPYKIVVKVTEIRGDCVQKHKVGDVIEFIGPEEKEGPTIRGHICPMAFNAIYPLIFGLRFGAELPRAKKGSIRGCCNDPDNLVVFQIERK